MSAMLPISTYNLRLVPGVPVSAKEDDVPLTVRITLASLDPTPVDDLKTPSTLRILKRPAAFPMGGMLMDDSDDDDDDEDFESVDEEDDDEDDEEEEEEEEKPKKKANGHAEDVEMGDAEDEDDDDDDESESDEEDDDNDFEPEEFVVCTLGPQFLYQQPLDIVISPDEEILFEVTGSYSICLLGNYVDNPNDTYESDEDDYDSDNEYDLSPDEDELLGYSSDESDELDDVDEKRIEEIVEDEKEAEEEIKSEAKLLKQIAKAVSDKKAAAAAKKTNGKRPAEDEVEETLDVLIENDKAAAPTPEPKLSKKQAKKLKTAHDAAAAGVAASPASADKEKDKKVTFAKNLEQGPTGSGSPAAAKTSTPAKPAVASSPAPVAAAESPKPKIQKLEGGLTIEDSAVGEASGPAAKPGQKVAMRYVGKLQSNGKMFDSNTKGKPFVFTLGKGEVIKGWDIGIKGMHVKGERRITIPPHLAYGKQKIPGIPPNSTLVFEVKLLSIK
ncbi:uncharacterized protein V1518DRAFT_418599 [Limtongia smithiae]|uniref:uncharacterized protein n=1 Tax=Limtongia smithiae TaxID=1125753 RepID=UPI0034CF3622